MNTIKRRNAASKAMEVTRKTSLKPQLSLEKALGDAKPYIHQHLFQPPDGLLTLGLRSVMGQKVGRTRETGKKVA